MSWTLLIFVMVGQFSLERGGGGGGGVGGDLDGLPASEKFSELFCTCFKISIGNLLYTSNKQRYMSS